MKICPITYMECQGRYSNQGLKKLSRSLVHLDDLPFTAEEQIREAAARAVKISIQGVQPKLSARLSPKHHRFELVDKGGRYILKPQTPQYLQLPENEDLTMRAAAAAGIDVPLHGLVYSKDSSMTYFVKRFDRIGKNQKVAVEDFSQLSGRTRATKYDSSMEKTITIIDRYCTFPSLERIKLFRLTVVNFLLGNEDMHLKNFSLISDKGRISLSPAYDLVAYFGIDRLKLNNKVIGNVLTKILSTVSEWNRLIEVSFLKDSLKKKYKILVKTRIKALSQGIPEEFEKVLNHG